MTTLTERQTAAARHFTGPAIVIAGPGSGKTRVLIERIRFLIEEKKIPPENILAVTFTEKATEEMSTRLFQTVGDKAEKVHVSTIHSLCRTIMEDYFIFHEYGASFNILDRETQKLFIIANRYKLDLGGEHGWRELILKAAGYMGNPEDQVCSLYNTITEHDIETKELANEIKTLGLYADDGKALLASYEKYCALLREEKLVDFAHLQTIALSLLKNHPEVRQAVQQRFTFALIDEYQDTSPVQDELISLIVAGHKNIFVVGDENQSIYGFRGAVVENFSRFPERYPGTKKYLLSTNFRSVKNIVDTANTLLESKIKEKLQAHRAKGNEIILITGENRRAVARNAVSFLKEKIEQGRISVGDIAFLYRKKCLADEITAALKEYGLPFITDNDGEFLERREIRDIINIFSYVHQGALEDTSFKDWNDWWRPEVFDNEILSFSKKTMEKLVKLTRDSSLHDITLEEKAAAHGISDRDDRRMLIELNLLRSSIEEKKSGLLDSLYEIFKISRYLSSLMSRTCPENEEKLFNLARFTGFVDSFERQFTRPSAKNLLWLLYNKTMEKGMDQVSVSDKNAAKCMTVHKAKGLEFPAVIVCSLLEGDFPLRFRPAEAVCGIPIPARLLKTTGTDENAHFEEELRLFYVAITRAQDLLIITVPEKINVKKARRSRFIEMIEKYVTGKIDADIKMETSFVPPRSTTALSYSAVHTFRECPFLYKINYLYQFVSPTDPMQRQGIIIHNVLQKVNWALKNGRQVMEVDIKQYIEQAWIPITGKKSDETLKKSYLKNTLKYLEFAKNKFTGIESFEKPFTYIDETMIVRGKTDLVAKDKFGKNVLIDFKARTKEGIEKTGVEEQLHIYRRCLKDVKIDRMGTFTFFDAEYTPFEYQEKTAKGILDYVSKGLEAQCFPLNKKSNLCGKCYYDFICKELKNG